MGFIIFIHTLVCILLMIAILMQSGRGGGLTEGFASAESMFGAKTNVFMVRITSVLATIFLVTCLSLAYFSARKNRSLMPNTIVTPKPASAALPPAVSSTTPLSTSEPSVTPPSGNANATQP